MPTKEKSKTAHVHDWMRSNRSAAAQTPKSIREGLAAQGVEVSLNTIHYAKRRLKLKGSKTKTKTKNEYEHHFTREHLFAVQKCVNELGSIEAVEDALGILKSLKG